jgi:hypothetical protein
VIGVAGRDNADTFEQWIRDRGVGGFNHIADPDGEIWRQFRITSQPAFVFINNDGTIDTRIGAMGLEGLTTRINELIAA